MVDYNMIDLSEMSVSLIGKMGPIKVDTQVAAHNSNLMKNVKRLLKADVIVVGSEGVAITPADVLDFLTKAKKHMQRETFDNGRSYHFEGIGQSGETNYYFLWGS